MNAFIFHLFHWQNNFHTYLRAHTHTHISANTQTSPSKRFLFNKFNWFSCQSHEKIRANFLHFNEVYYCKYDPAINSYIIEHFQCKEEWNDGWEWKRDPTNSRIGVYIFYTTVLCALLFWHVNKVKDFMLFESKLLCVHIFIWYYIY